MGVTAALTAALTPRGVHAQGKEELRLGFIGCGSRSSGAANEALRADESVKLVAMCDIFEERLNFRREFFVEEYPDRVELPKDHCPIGFDAYRKVIALCDLVIIACTSKFHGLYAYEAAQAGKHVFLEKPHATDPGSWHLLCKGAEIAKRNGTAFASGLQSRWRNDYSEAVQRIHDGQIGEIVALQSTNLRGANPIVSRRPEQGEMQSQFQNWQQFQWLSGGDVTQAFVHNLDRIQWVMREEAPKQVYALAGRSGILMENAGDLFDHQSLVYEYESGPKLFANCRTSNNCFCDTSDAIMGTKGTCLLGNCTFVDRRKNVYWKYAGKKGMPTFQEQVGLIQSIKNGPPLHNGSYMLTSSMLGIIGQVAASQGDAILWNEMITKKFHFGPEPQTIDFDATPPTLPDSQGFYKIPVPGHTHYGT